MTTANGADDFGFVGEAPSNRLQPAPTTLQRWLLSVIPKFGLDISGTLPRQGSLCAAAAIADDRACLGGNLYSAARRRDLPCDFLYLSELASSSPCPSVRDRGVSGRQIGTTKDCKPWRDEITATIQRELGQAAFEPPHLFRARCSREIGAVVRYLETDSGAVGTKHHRGR